MPNVNGRVMSDRRVTNGAYAMRGWAMTKTKAVRRWQYPPGSVTLRCGATNKNVR